MAGAQGSVVCNVTTNRYELPDQGHQEYGEEDQALQQRKALTRMPNLDEKKESYIERRLEDDLPVDSKEVVCHRFWELQNQRSQCKKVAWIYPS